MAISVDHLPAQRVFNAASGQFPFPLAADWHRGICRSYGVLDEEHQTARRVLMLCDEQSIIRHVVDNFDPSRPELLDQLLHAVPATAAELSLGPAPAGPVQMTTS